MDIYKITEKAMKMDDATWARHSNPWSVYTRFSCLPLLVLAIWSRQWLGWWSLGPVAITLFWIWLNPRLFGPPETTDNWASKGTFGERFFLNRRKVPVPPSHVAWANGLTAVMGLGLPLLGYGLWVLEPFAAFAGLVLVFGPKVWFVDRMVWLYEDMIRLGHNVPTHDAASH